MSPWSHMVDAVAFSPGSRHRARDDAVCALSMAAAVFLILELEQPFWGLIRMSNAPLREALLQLGR